MTNLQQHFLIIVNHIPPYDREVAALLGTPEGGHTKFRFQRKYLPSLKDVSSLIGETGLICLRDRMTGRLFPVRKAYMNSARWVAGIAYMDVDLLETVPYYEDEAREAQLREAHEAISAQLGKHRNDAETDLRNLVLLETGSVFAMVTDWEQYDQSELDRWEAVAHTISTTVSGRSSDYFRFVDISTESGLAVPLEGSYGERAYPLSPGQTYLLAVLQRSYTGTKGDSSLKETRHLEVIPPSQAVAVPEARRQIVGKYDVLTFPFTLDRFTALGRTSMHLKISGEQLEREYAAQIPLTITRRGAALWAYVATACLWLASLITYLVPTWVQAFLSFLPGNLGSPPSETAIEKGAIVVLILTSYMSSSPVARLISDKFKLG